MRSSADRLVVSDASGRVIGDTAGEWLNRTSSSVGLTDGTPITVSGQEVGKLYLVSTQEGAPGRGFMGGGRGSVTTAVGPESAEEHFLDRINRSLLLTGLIAAVIALAVGLVLTRLITNPVQALTHGAHKIAEGNLAHRVSVQTKDELGELGHSFNAMAASLEEAEQERKRIIADIAHELRTPLTIIEGTVVGIEDRVFEPDSARLGVIKEQVALLTRLTSDLRELSLAESGQLKLELAPTDLVDLVRRKAMQFESQAAEKGVHVATELPPSEQRANVDSGRIEQVLANLLSNAIRHTPSGGTITVSVGPGTAASGAPNARSVLISVADTGEGIAPEHIPHLFERFYRVETSRSRSGGGAGLGLAIVKRMVEAHGGRVWVESQPGKGATFRVEIPV